MRTATFFATAVTGFFGLAAAAVAPSGTTSVSSTGTTTSSAAQGSTTRVGTGSMKGYPLCGIPGIVTVGPGHPQHFYSWFPAGNGTDGTAGSPSKTPVFWSDCMEGCRNDAHCKAYSYNSQLLRCQLFNNTMENNALDMDASMRYLYWDAECGR